MIFAVRGCIGPLGGYQYLLAAHPAILLCRVIHTGIKPTCWGVSPKEKPQRDLPVGYKTDV